MTSAVYPNFARIFTVCEADGTTPRFTLPSAIVEHAAFTLCADKGCAGGELIVAPADENVAVDRARGFLLNQSDVVYFKCEAETDAVYCGTVVTRNIVNDGGKTRHIYRLDGLGRRLIGLPPTDGNDPLLFGSGAGTGDTAHSDVYFVCAGSGLGIVNWLYFNSIPEEFGFAGLETFDYNWMIYNNDSKVTLWEMSAEEDLFNLLGQLALRCVDLTNTTYPQPCLWGVGPDRKVYFGYRGDTELIRIKRTYDPAVARGDALITRGGVALAHEPISDEDESLFYNSLYVSAGIDDDGNQIEGYYSDDASITKYRQIRKMNAVLPGASSLGELAHYANGFFARYADPPRAFRIPRVAATCNADIIMPWLGYARVIDSAYPLGTEWLGKQTVLSVDVTFDATPIMDIYIGDIRPDANIPVDGNAVSPGSASMAAENRRPRPRLLNKRQAARIGTTGTVLLPAHAHWDGYDGGILAET